MSAMYLFAKALYKTIPGIMQCLLRIYAAQPCKLYAGKQQIADLLMCIFRSACNITCVLFQLLCGYPLFQCSQLLLQSV